MQHIKWVMAIAVVAIIFYCRNIYGQTKIVPQWSVYEIELHSNKQYNNPYLDAKVKATFAGPDNIQKTIYGFWDGGSTFRIRYTPTVTGVWHYQTFSTDAELNHKTGNFTCTRAKSKSYGFIRIDQKYPYHFVYDDGRHYFLFGTTYYNIVANAKGHGNWRKSIDGIHQIGINKVRLETCSIHGNHHGGEYPNSSPFISTHDQLNINHFRIIDTIVQYMLQKNVTADLILLHSGDENFGTMQQDEHYIRYMIHRYAAYPNVIWCLTNEWNYTEKDKAYWDTIGMLIRKEDPWMNRNGYLRPLSTHQQTRIDFQFFDTDWPTFACIQYGVRNKGYKKADKNEWKPSGGTKYHQGDEWGNAGILFNMGHNMPVVNDEYGYAGEPDDESAGGITLTRKKQRQIMWGIYTAGGYGSTGDKYTYKHPPGRPYFTADWHYIREYDDIKHLIDFFTKKGIHYWEMQSMNNLVKEGKRVYVLANPDHKYVIYTATGGAFSISLNHGKYIAKLFDPRTGNEKELTVIKGKSNTSFNTPAGQDWVIYLEKK